MKTAINIVAFLLIATVSFAQAKKQDKIVVDANEGTPYTGTYTEKYENGNLKLKANFINGYADGEYFLYFESGNIKEKRSYSMGLFNGTWIRYDADGTIQSKANYNNGIKDGKWEINDVYANKTIVIQYENGNKKSAEYEENGVVFNP